MMKISGQNTAFGEGAGLDAQVRQDGVNAYSDEDLLHRIAAGDRRAMEALYLRHHVRVYRFVLRLVSDPVNAEDLTSDVFLEVWKHARRFEGRSQASTWMLSIARHKALSALRGRAPEPLEEEVLAGIPDASDNGEIALQRRERAATLQQCLTQLSAAHRQIVDLVYYHGQSIEDVAAITGVPQNTVKTRMFYARKHLAKLLGAHGFDAAA
jgi:RNA polymerase sigma-70 factor (ECF subfamily)